MTHAFFKALLFLGAGSVIHALSGEQDIRYMGGLRKHTPITFLTLLAGSLAIAGFPYTSGFFSKDEILVAAYHRAPWMFWIGALTALMTAFYVFRALFLTFFGTYRGPNLETMTATPHGMGEGEEPHHSPAQPHESPPVMTIPLIVLALGSLFGGFLSVPHWLAPMFPVSEHHDTLVVVVSIAAGLLGIALAYFMYVLRPEVPEAIARNARGVYTLVYNKYFVDELYDATIIQPIKEGSRAVLWRGADVGFIDALVNGVGTRARGVGNVFRLFQGGNIRTYAAWVVLGSVLAVIYMGLGGAR
jgi:NADH-quinone oxidoreductase subunit L